MVRIIINHGEFLKCTKKKHLEIAGKYITAIGTYTKNAQGHAGNVYNFANELNGYVKNIQVGFQGLTPFYGGVFFHL